MVPKEETILIVEHELEGATAWAGRHGVPLDWLPEILEVRAILTQRSTNEKFYLRADLGDYRELPPAWRFCDETWTFEAGPRNFPRPDNPPSGSIFHGNHFICAPFNRLAYSVNGGPHGDWSFTRWHSLPGNLVKATTIGDMLEVVFFHMGYSRGRMG